MGDPVGTGLVASLARPGGNVTGLRRLAFLGNVGNPITVLEMGALMTELGHERPKGDVRLESVRLPSADIGRRGP